MKIKTTLLLTLFYAFTASAQIAYTYDPNQILLNLTKLTQAEIDDLIIEFEVEERWVSPLSETRLWHFSSFPGVHEIVLDGDTYYLYNILEAAELVKSRSSGGTGGVSVGLNATPKYTIQAIGPTYGGFNPNLYNESGTNGVLLSILDSGITYDVDDSEGYDYNPDIVNAKSYIDGTPVDDDNGHGTHVSGIANHIGTKTSPLANVIDIDVRKILNMDNRGSLAEYIFAIEEAIVSGAQVLNLSLSFPEVEGNFFVNILIRLLESHNILGVVAAGNDGLNLSQGNINFLLDKNIFPAALQSPNLITVASVNTTSSRLSGFSNYGISNVDVAVTGEFIPGYNIDSDFVGMSGTSQATAIVSGIAANLGTYQTTFDGAEIKCAIVAGVDHVAGLEGKIVSEGIVNAQTALSLLLSPNNCLDHGSDRIAFSPEVESEIYPNPFDSELNIQLKQGANKIIISDMLGKVLYSSVIEVPVDGKNHQINNMETFPHGVYVLTIKNRLMGINYATKIIKK